MGLINIFYHGVIWVQGKVQQNDIYDFYDDDDEGSTFTSNQRYKLWNDNLWEKYHLLENRNL